MKFMLLQEYGGVPADVPPISEWKAEDIDAHIQFQRDLNAELEERGELVDARAHLLELRGERAARLNARR